MYLISLDAAITAAQGKSTAFKSPRDVSEGNMLQSDIPHLTRVHLAQDRLG